VGARTRRSRADDRANAVSTLTVGGRRVEQTRLGTGPPLLYLHGLADVHSLFAPDDRAPLVDALAAHREVLTVALPGYGASDPLAPAADLEEHSFALADLLDELGLDRVDVVGTCFGGWMAAELALRHPGRIGRLALVAPLGLHVPGAAGAAFFGAAAPRGIGGFGEVRAVLFADPDSPAALAALPEEPDRDRALRWFSGLAAAAALGWTAPQLCDRRLGARLHRIAAPTLLVWGAEDRMTPVAHAHAWLQGLPAARLEVVDGAGHCVHLEDPGRVTSLVVDFLTD